MDEEEGAVRSRSRGPGARTILLLVAAVAGLSAAVGSLLYFLFLR
jgi:hypothetical protein